MRKLDIFPHIFPKAYFDKMVEVIPNKAAVRRWTAIPVLYDLDARLRMMEEFGDYQQILHPLDAGDRVRRAGRDVARRWRASPMTAWPRSAPSIPNEFPGFVASVPMNNVKATLDEMTRAIEKLGARGIQIFTNVNGRPLDDPEFAPIFEKMHVLRPADLDASDAARGLRRLSRPRSSRNTTSGGCSAGPMRPARRWRAWCSRASSTAGRTSRSSPIIWARWRRSSRRASGLGLDQLGTREAAEPHYAKLVADMKAKGRSPVDYFQHVLRRHRDQRLGAGHHAAASISSAATMCMFGTDCPFDPEGGPLFIRDIDQGDRQPRPLRGRARQDLSREYRAVSEAQAVAKQSPPRIFTWAPPRSCRHRPRPCISAAMSSA